MNRAANTEHECTVASVKQTQTFIIKPKMKGVTTKIDRTKKKVIFKSKGNESCQLELQKMLSKLSIASEYLLFDC